MAKQKLTQSVFAIDAKRYASLISKFIAGKMTELRRDGIVVPISGGLDSSVVASLSVMAAGRKKVTGLLLPEKEGNPEADKYARLAARSIGIKTHTIDISRALRAAGAYDFILFRVPGRKAKASLVRMYNEKENQILTFYRGTKNSLIRSGVASFFIKQRMRLVAVCKYAEERNLLVCGSAHRSEDLVGLFVKFGVDDAADVMPLKHLYRSQILQLARYCGVPREIVSRAPNPDLVPGVNDKYADILRVDAGEVDLILYGLESGMSPGQIARDIRVNEKRVADIAELVRLTAHMRNPSMAPVFEGQGKMPGRKKKVTGARREKK